MYLASEVSTDKYSNWFVHPHSFSVRCTLRCISNSCSNYTFPEGLVINCEDALGGGAEMEETARG